MLRKREKQVKNLIEENWEEEGKRKGKVETVVSLKSQKTISIVLSAHARTSEGDILHHQKQKATKCIPCKQPIGNFCS